jgi:hypothetical protein
VNVNPDSRAETNPAESCPLRHRAKKSSILVLQCEYFLLIKKMKGGESMKIKVNVRAGGVKARA